MSEVLPLEEVFEICVASAVSGEPVIPEKATLQYDLRDNPFGGLGLTVQTDAGDVWVEYNRNDGALVGCSVWGGNFRDETAPFTVTWADHGHRALDWLHARGGKADAIDSRVVPKPYFPVERIVLCPDAEGDAFVASASSFTYEGEADEEAPFDDPAGALNFGVSRDSELNCAELRRAEHA